MIHVIESMENLKEVIIGSFEFIKSCSSKIFKALESKTILRSLAILNIDGRDSRIESDVMIRLWKNNPDLQTLILCRCNFVTDKDFAQIAEHCKGLRTLSLGECHKIEGESIWSFTSLVNLEIDTCKNFDHGPALDNIDMLTNLEYLCVNFKIKDKHEANKLIMKISRLHKLKYLDINHNNFDDEGSRP